MSRQSFLKNFIIVKSSIESSRLFYKHSELCKATEMNTTLRNFYKTMKMNRNSQNSLKVCGNKINSIEYSKNTLEIIMPRSWAHANGGNSRTCWNLRWLYLRCLRKSTISSIFPCECDRISSLQVRFIFNGNPIYCTAVPGSSTNF